MREEDAPGEGWRRWPLVVHSIDDPAGCNIHRHLLRLGPWEARELAGRPFWTGTGRNLLGVEGRLVDQDGLDRWALDAGLQPPLIVFASCHRSPDGRAVLTSHHTGNPGAAELGGRPKELARPAPAALKAAYLALARRCPAGFQVTLEATHHGPSDLDVPSLFVEIGSGPDQWGMPAPGEAAARSILDTAASAEAVVAAATLVSFGGTHYAPRQNRILAETSATFGHIFADHSLADLDDTMVRLALELSGTRLVHLDRKALAAAERVRLFGLLERCGATVVGEGELRRRWPSAPGGCPLGAGKRVPVPRLLPGGARSEVTAVLASALKCCTCPTPYAPASAASLPPEGTGCPRLVELAVDGELASLCLRLDRRGTLDVLSGFPAAYHLPSRAGEAFRVWTLSGDPDTARRLADGLFSVLAARGVLRFDPAGAVLSLTERKLDPARALALGVPPGPLFARLAAGEVVELDRRRVRPEDVMRESVTRVRLHHFASAAASLSGDDNA